VHGRDPDLVVIPAFDGMIPISASRTPIAYSNCVKTKTRCDQQVPCLRCAGRGINYTPRVKGRAIQNATSMYEVMTPEELAISDSHSALAAIAENRRPQAPAQTTNARPGQVRPILKLGNADNRFESMPGHKEIGLFVDVTLLAPRAKGILPKPTHIWSRRARSYE
jgi:hypothetical protein